MIYKDIKRPPRRSGGLFYRGSTLSAVLYRAADGVLSLSMKIIRFYIENCKGKYVFIAKCAITEGHSDPVASTIYANTNPMANAYNP